MSSTGKQISDTMRKTSRRMIPRRIYVFIMKQHPIISGILLTLWTVFWTTLAFLFELLLILIVVITITAIVGVFVAALTGDSDVDLDLFDDTFLYTDFGRNKKKRKKQ